MMLRTARNLGLAALLACMSGVSLAPLHAGERNTGQSGGFSEVDVPQVRGALPASTQDVKASGDAQAKAGSGASATVSTAAPESCNQANAESQACHTAVQQAH